MVVGFVGIGWFFVQPRANVTVVETGGDYTLEAAPGLGYQYRWDADGNGEPDTEKFSKAATSQALHLDPGGKKTVRLEVTNAFGLKGSKEVSLERVDARAEVIKADTQGAH
ncbi:MAG: hypothetical protein U0169_20040 [Polyangiaceae bacterium]